MVLDVPRNDFSGMLSVAPQYLEGFADKIRLLRLNDLASRFYRRDAFSPQLIVVSTDDGYRVDELIHLFAFDEMSQGARCAYFRYEDYYNQDIAGMIRHNVRQLKRKGVKNHRTFVTFDDICTTYMSSYEALCEMILELLSLNAFVVVHILPEYRDAIARLLPSAIVINQNELMSARCLVTADSMQDDELVLWQLSHGIPQLLQALDHDRHSKYLPYDVRCQYVRALADLLSKNFTRPYVFAHAGTYIAAALMGSGQIEDLQTINGVDTQCLFMYETDFLPAFYIDRELDTFEVAGICDDLIFATAHTGFDGMLVGHHELVWECACALAEKGRYLRAAEVMSICLQERKPKCILPSDRYIQRLLPHACGFISAGRIDIIEFLESYLKRRMHLETPEWQHQVCRAAYQALSGVYSKKLFTKAFASMQECGADSTQVEHSLKSLVHCREALVHRIKPQKLVVFRRYAHRHLRDAHIFTHALNMVLEGHMSEAHTFLEKRLPNLVPRNFLEFLLFELYTMTSKLCAQESQELTVGVYYQHAQTKWLKGEASVAYVNYAHAMIDLLMGKATRFYEAQNAVELAIKQKDKLLAVIFRFGLLVDLVYQGLFVRAEEYAQELVASARSMHLDYIVDACMFVRFLCEIELTSSAPKSRMLTSPLGIYMELAGQWGSAQLSYQTQHSHHESRELLDKNSISSVKNSLWALVLTTKAFPHVSRSVTRHIPLEWLHLLPYEDLFCVSRAKQDGKAGTSHSFTDMRDMTENTRYYLITSEDSLFKKCCMENVDSKIPKGASSHYKKKRQIIIKPVRIPEVYEKAGNCVLIDDVDKNAYKPEQRLSRIDESSRSVTRPVHIKLFNHMEITIHGEPELTSKLHVRHGNSVLALLALSQDHRATRYHIISSIWGDCDFEYGMKRLYESVAHIRRCFLQNGVKHVLLVNKGNGTIRLNTDLVSCDIDEFEKLAKSAIYFEASDGQILKKGCQALDIYGMGIDFDIHEASGHFLRRNDEVRKLAIHTSMLVSSVALRHARQHLAEMVVQQAFLMAPFRDDTFLQLVKVFAASGRISEISYYYKIYQENLKLLGISAPPLDVMREMEQSMQGYVSHPAQAARIDSSKQKKSKGIENTNEVQHKRNGAGSSESIA